MAQESLSLPIYIGVFFIAMPTFIGLNNDNLAALNLNPDLANYKLLSTELGVCIFYAILLVIILHAHGRYSKPINIGISDNNINRFLIGLCFVLIGFFFSLLNIYCLPLITQPISNYIHSWQAIFLMLATIIISLFLWLLPPLLLTKAIKNTQNKAKNRLKYFAYIFITIVLILNILQNTSIIQSKKVIAIMHKFNLCVASALSIILLFFLFIFFVNYIYTKCHPVSLKENNHPDIMSDDSGTNSSFSLTNKNDESANKNHSDPDPMGQYYKELTSYTYTRIFLKASNPPLPNKSHYYYTT